MRWILWVLAVGCLVPWMLGAEDGPYHLSKPRLVPDTLSLIQEDYVDPSRAKPLPLLKGALDQVQKSVPEIVASCTDAECSVTVGMANRRFAVGNMATLADLNRVIESIFSFIELHYHGKTKLNEIEYAAIDGMLNVLDPHSNLLPPKIYTEFKIGTRGNFGGIGIVIGTRDGELTVISPLEGTPAFRAGIKANDRITQIGDDSTINMTLTEAVEKLRGAVGTPVSMTIDRPSRGSFTVTLKRAIIKIQSVQSKLLTAGSKAIGYVRVKSFQENTDRDMVHDLEAMQKKLGRPLDGVILDMRNNPGGLLNQAISIADYFLTQGAIVSTVGVDNHEMKRDNAHDAGGEPTYPMIVLINEGSASASEIVAGALQANHRAEVIGSQSFGKGSVQQVFDLQDNSALKLTVAEYLTAAKYSIQSVGITPDITLIPMTVDKKSMDLLENDYSGEKDLERHLDRPIPNHNRATFKLFYFNPAEPEKSDDELSSKEYSNTLDLANDFAVTLSEKLLEAAVAETTSLLKKVEQEEMDKLSKQMEQLGIDWNTGPASGKPQVQVSVELQNKGQVVSHLKAGEEGQIVLKAHNSGSAPLYRLIATTKLDEALFTNKEFVFGKLLPGSTRSWSMPVKMPKASPSLTLPIKLYFNSAPATSLATTQILVPVVGQPRPQFAFRYALEAPAARSSGEPLAVGKLISLSISVKNLGPGISQDTVVSLKNSEAKGAFLQVGRVKLGKLAPQQTATAVLKFRIDPEFSASTLKLDLAITDANVFESIIQPLVFTVGSGAVQPESGPWYQAPRIVVSSIKLPVTTTAASQVVQGQITDDRGVKDYVVFVGDQKVSYQPNPDNTAEFPFKVTLPLKPGTNFVTISARDDAELTSRLTFTLLRNIDKSHFWKSLLE